MTAFHRTADELSKATPVLVFQIDGADQKIDHDRYLVYANDEVLGSYDAYGYDHAIQSIERRLLSYGIIPESVKLLGNGIHIICNDEMCDRMKRTSKLILSIK